MKSIKVLILINIVLVLLGACSTATPEVTQTSELPVTAPVETATGEPITTEQSQSSDEVSLAEIAPTRTAMPTVTPNALHEEVERITEDLGIDSTVFLGISAADWITLGVSLGTVLLGFLLTWFFVRVLLRYLARRTSTELDDTLIKKSGTLISLFVLMILLSNAAQRQLFFSPQLKTILDDIFFVITAIIGFVLLWRFIDIGIEWYRSSLEKNHNITQLDPVITMISRVARFVMMVVALIVVLDHFGINVTALTAALGIAGLALGLAAQDTLSDTISGFIILADQPFRVGDRIQIEKISTWGDVVEIGLRTTRIRTRDNRMVIVPNSVIGKSQVINYTFPDSRYRIETHLNIAYGTSIDRAREVIVNAIREIPGILEDKPVDALYIEMGDSAMIFRVRWWIESYEDTRRVYDTVHTALQKALDDAGIEMPYPIQQLKIQMEGGQSEGTSGGGANRKDENLDS